MTLYNFEFVTRVDISETVAKEMVARIIEEQTGKKVTKIEAKTRTEYYGYGPNETAYTVFDGFTVYF